MVAYRTGGDSSLTLQETPINVYSTWILNRSDVAVARIVPTVAENQPFPPDLAMRTIDLNQAVQAGDKIIVPGRNGRGTSGLPLVAIGPDGNPAVVAIATESTEILSSAWFTRLTHYQELTDDVNTQLNKLYSK
jgi:hypothetical protein